MTAQRLVLRLRAVAPFRGILALWYGFGIAIFTRFAFGGAVTAVYLRRSGGRGELLPGASDLDFFLVLRALPAEREMEFLKKFWRSYAFWRRIFPFFGETLMGEETELRHWLESAGVRAHEARYAWRLLRGREARVGLAPAKEPLPRDIYSEALKCYDAILQPVLKLEDQRLTRALRPWSRGAVPLRHAAKATLDLFRLHHASSLPISEREKVWRCSRRELLHVLPTEKYGPVGELAGLLTLEAPLFPKRPPLELFAGILRTANECLDELARGLEAESGEGWRILPEPSSSTVDRYSLSVRELFAERVLLRHPFLTRAVLSEANTHLYFLFNDTPNATELASLIEDLREISFSFDRFSVALPLTERAFRESQRTPVFDTPFHAFSRQREARVTAEGIMTSSPLPAPAAYLPENMLAKTFAELSFSLRLPPREMGYFLEGMVGLVLGLRVASERREVAPGFHSALAHFTARYPDRGAVLAERLGPFLDGAAEEEFWDDTFRRLSSVQAPALREQLARLRASNRARVASRSQTTDLWINLTPFLRMEMGALEEKYFRPRNPMKV